MDGINTLPMTITLIKHIPHEIYNTIVNERTPLTPNNKIKHALKHKQHKAP